MTRMRNIIGGALALAALAVAGWAVREYAFPPPTTPVAIAYGGEKSGLLADPRMQQALTDARVRLDAVRMGSVEMTTTADVSRFDCLWPSNSVATELARRSGKPVLASDEVLTSPIVLFAWAEAAEALVKKGVLRDDGGVLRADLAQIARLIEARPDWRADLGVPSYGSFRVMSTDPERSNSGNVWAALLATAFNGGRVPGPGDMDAIAPRITAYFADLGYMEGSSGDLFRNFLAQGVGGRPVIVGYENQGIEVALENPELREAIARNIRVIYPEPTVFAAHPVISLTPGCKSFVQAMKSPAVQQIAQTGHGFRSALAGSGTQALGPGFASGAVPAVPMPSVGVVERILDAVR